MINLKVYFQYKDDVAINPHFIESVKRDGKAAVIQMNSGSVYRIEIDDSKEESQLREIENLA